MARYFKQLSTYLKIGSFLEKNEHFGPISNIISVLNPRDRELQSDFETFTGTTTITIVAAKTATQIQRSAFDTRRNGQHAKILKTAFKNCQSETIP